MRSLTHLTLKNFIQVITSCR